MISIGTDGLNSSRVTQLISCHCLETQPEDAAELLTPQLVVWGTDVSVARCQERFRRFLREFRLSDFVEGGGSGGLEDGDAYANVAEPTSPFYMQKLDEIKLIEEPFMAINCSHLKWFDVSLYRQLVSYPVEVIPALDIAVNQEFFTKYPDTDLEHQIQVRFCSFFLYTAIRKVLQDSKLPEQVIDSKMNFKYFITFQNSY